MSLNTSKEDKLKAFSRLLDVMDTLREKCPWDREQTNESLRINTIEEVHELSDAILQNSPNDIKKELGDILLHIVFYSKIGEEKGEFDIGKVCDSLCDKLIYRHPHIYSDVSINNTDEVMNNWERLKQREKDGNKSVLSGVPSSLPSIIKAQRVQDKARGVGFDWQKKEDVWAKVEEEIAEWHYSIDNETKERREQEFGDILFSLVNVARLYGINPDNALEGTTQKFIKRFGYIEQKAKDQNKEISSLTPKEMDDLWNEAKYIINNYINKL